MATASVQTDPLALNSENVEERLKTRKINHLQYYNGDTHQGVFALPNYVRDLLSADLRPITELAPMDEPGLDPQNHIPLKVVQLDQE